MFFFFLNFKTLLSLLMLLVLHSGVICNHITPLQYGTSSGFKDTFYILIYIVLKSRILLSILVRLDFQIL